MPRLSPEAMSITPWNDRVRTSKHDVLETPLSHQLAKMPQVARGKVRLSSAFLNFNVDCQSVDMMTTTIF